MQVDPKEALMVSLKREVQLLRAENSYFRSQVSTNTHIPRTSCQWGNGWGLVLTLLWESSTL